jgi:hypothetical protein
MYLFGGKCTFYNTPTNASSLSYDEEVNLNTLMPTDIKQKDFITSIVKMFNLILDEDKNNPKNIIIEKRDDYYNSGTTVDWTDKEDISSETLIERIPTLVNKDIHFTYQSDTDDYNKEYSQTNNNLIFGEYTEKTHIVVMKR